MTSNRSDPTTEGRLNKRLKSLANAGAKALRNLVFVGLSLSPLFWIPALYFWLWESSLQNWKTLLAEHWLWIASFETLFCVLVSLQSVIVFQILAPLWILILIPHERIKDPKLIIRYGEKFREKQLSTPDILLIQVPWWPRTLQGLIGFLSLPRPFQALVTLKAAASSELNESEFSFWIHRLTAIGDHKIQGRMWLWTHIFSLLGFSFAGPMALISIPALAMIYRTTELAIDRWLVLSLEGLPSIYWSMLRKIYGNWFVPRFRSEQFFDFKERAWAQQTHWVPAILGLSAVLGSLHMPWKISTSDLLRAPDFASKEQRQLYEWIDQGNLKLLQQSQNQIRVQHWISQKSPDFENLTPLLWAAKKSTPQIIYWLLQQGASLSDRDPLGRSALFWSIENPDPQMFDYLLQGKWELQEKDATGKNILDLAREKNRTQIVQILEKKLDLLPPPREPATFNE
ncbi:MAG: ankyrin repeat domain-containing protein [Bdellovibrio sp.]